MLRRTPRDPSEPTRNKKSFLLKKQETRISFRGVILPVNDKDLIRDTAGTYMHCTEKIYTNGHALQIGARVMDQDGTVYTITQELGHNSIHPMKRYLVERKGDAAKR